MQKLPPTTNVGVLALNSTARQNNRERDPHWIVPLGPLDSRAAIQRINQIRAEGGTPLGANMMVAADALIELRKKQVYGEYRLLVVTDGEATDRRDLDRYLPVMMARGIIVDVIGVDMRSQHSLATKVHQYRSADDPVALQQAVQQVFAESSDSATDGEEAFELLSGLPDDVAAEILSAISKRDDRVIRDGFQNQNPATTPDQTGSQRTTTAPVRQATNNDNGSDGIAVSLGGTTCCCLIIPAMIVAILFLLNAQTKR